MKSLEFRIRKLHVTNDTDKRLQKRQPSRLYVNEEALLELTGSRDGGSLVYVERASSASASASASTPTTPTPREATLWKAPEKLDKTVTQMYDAFRDACGYKLGEQVRITSLKAPLPDAEEVVIEPVPSPAQDDKSAPTALAPEDLAGWEYMLAGRLSQIEHVYAGLAFKNLFLRGPERSFVVTSVNGRNTGNAKYVDRKTAVKLATTPLGTWSSHGDNNGTTNTTSPTGKKLQVTGIRGLDPQIRQLNQILSYFSTPLPFHKQLSYRGIVLHGGHGTGKTMLLNHIAATGWGTVFRIQYKDKLTEIQETFQRATLQQPSIVLVDQLERLIDKDRSNRAAVILALCEALDALAADAAAKGVLPRVVVVATCLDYTVDVPEDLKEPRRLTSEVYLSLPDASGRREILAALGLGVVPEQEEEVLRDLSERTHAYNGKDLCRLVDEADLIAHARVLTISPEGALPSNDTASSDNNDREDKDGNNGNNGNNDNNGNNGNNGNNDTDNSNNKIYRTPSDYHSALRLIRPSAMHDINLKPPPIHWSDIGGQERVKLSLRRAVRLSTEPPETLARYFDRPPKGFLLYGPPGCSKTMAAQAMATESGLNFFAVKGAELLNMYVGESERAVRRLFQRAREVSPSMIFFDEIDSIAGQRSGFSSGSSGPNRSTGGSSTGGGINVLTTLLNEMDGFEALHGVVVLAATNRPQALDPALLRPGRFDELIYVSPPDTAARRAIFAQVASRRLMHADVDIDRLAGATEGFSGAEIKGICAAAGVVAYDRSLGGLLTQEGETEGEEDREPAIRMGDLERAIGNQKRQITPEMLRGFEEWEKQFRKF
ncbi:P-loop containing nucleoside triphosphate hydrolase protein [Dichotomopilus funicola]|uniref:P-loop containing nucleoside triphosphate hydrolase protein n=1 Tax=Dichotomopilus funicola TaxID=1934379 RepID=A0AAN6V8P8_9PEZI|nr:P-loop containing nucleoside triphosphate hydrolase protein [Dichotomopilus funicola]